MVGVVSQVVTIENDIQSFWGDRLRRTAGVGVGSTKTVERYVDFFLAYLVALVEDVSEVSLNVWVWESCTLSWHIWCIVRHARHRRVSSLSVSAAIFALSASWLSMMSSIWMQQGEG